MKLLTFPLLRPEIVLEPRYLPGLGEDRLHYVAADPVTEAHCWLTESEGHIARALQQLKGEQGCEAVAGYVRLHFAYEVNDEQIATCMDRLTDLGWLKSETPTGALRAAYWDKRRSEQRARALQRLRAAIKRLREEVPYYRALLEKEQLTEADLHDQRDLAKFPRLTKTLLREHFDTLHPESLEQQPGWWGELVWRSSSGSTGARTQTLAGVNNYAYTLYQTLGPLAPPQPARVCLIIPPACTGATCHMDTAVPYEHRILFGNVLLMNAFRNACTVSDARMEEYLQEIERFKPVGLMGAGSYMYPLARYLQRTGKPVPKIRFIHLHVEVCSRIHRRLLEEVFGCPVSCCYVSSEMGFAAVECARGNYHVGPGVHLEVLAGDQPAGPGQLGRVVATTLTTHNRLTPLLRYELGDLALAATEPCLCSPLGHLPNIASLEGRAAEAIATTTGRIVTPRAVDLAITGGSWCGNVAFYNVVQQTRSRYLLEVVLQDKQQPLDDAGLTQALHDLLGEDAEIEIKRREEIVPTQPAGRYRLCFSQLDTDLSALLPSA